MNMTVIYKKMVAADTVRITFAATNGGELPAFNSGAHIELFFAGLARRYSLTSAPHNLSQYEICVLHAHPSRGGSAYLHDQLSVGDKLQSTGPFNSFSLNLAAKHTVFIAGGIGITPFLSMMNTLEQSLRPFELHYAVRSPDRFLPVPDYSGQICLYSDVDGTQNMDIHSILDQLLPDADIYVCGPRELIEAVHTNAIVRGWSDQQIHFESFGAGLKSTDGPVKINLALSGLSFVVPPGTTILDALLANGVWAPYECRRGECASCMTEVLSGEPDHRDICLTERQRLNSMCTCVSWGRTSEIVLNL